MEDGYVNVSNGAFHWSGKVYYDDNNTFNDLFCYSDIHGFE